MNLINRKVNKKAVVSLEVTGRMMTEIKGKVFGNQPIDLVNTFEQPHAIGIREYQVNSVLSEIEL